MRIDSMLRLNIGSKDGALIQKLCRLLTYPNPKHQDAKRLGFSTHGILPEIKNYEISSDGTALTTTRGEINKVREVFPGEKIEDDFQDYGDVGVRYQNDDFELDERQERAVEAILKKKQGIIHAATSAGKSAIILAAIGRRGRAALVVVHRKVLLDQLVADARKYLRDKDGNPFTSIGVLGGGENTHGVIQFAIDKSLKNFLEKKPNFKSSHSMLIQDECHLAACTTFQDIINKFSGPRFGFTGTLKRKDRMEFLIYATYGNVIATITKDELLEADRVSPVEVAIVESETEVDPTFFDLPTTKRWQAIDKALHEDVLRTSLIRDKVKELLRDGKRVVVLSRYVEPTEKIASQLAREGIDTNVVNGKRDNAHIACNEFEDGEVRVLCATIGCFSTGVNIPNLTDIILISPIFNNELLIHQIRGRLMRKSEGKTHGTLHFVWDPYVFPSHNLSRFKAIMKR